MTDLDMETLINKLESPKKEERMEAVKTLGTIKVDASVDALIKTFNDDDPEVRLQATKSLALIGDLSVKPLVEQLKVEEGYGRRYATYALKDIGDAAAVQNLIQALKDDDWGVRKFSALALGEIGDKQATEPIIALLEDEDWGVKVAATRALGDLKDERAIDPIKKARRKATGDKEYKKVANKVLKKLK